jgi:uncharacterized protein involved in copper resistance
MTDFSAYQQLVATAHAAAKERARWAAALAPKPTPSVMTEAQAIAADLHNERDKAHTAHLAQTLNAVRLEFQHAQEGAAA